ncbi:Chs5p-Arf1p-binding proteins-domain-containing protein [Phascolomyces articulosus]|uniref:Chs5p-Arf1p-binding proteins-domain-containing protein n=1 Tax=Phascolomyces articulosus TaxID=60185 RepID=A0AAD5JLQ3_9FUNG|nr:Chs5p-Arf1p-binding proteins-domain-containing protein [Phascolomyces articulosus]
MGEMLKDVPEFFETELGESIIARTDALGTFRELGPPDLCHIIKTNAKPGVRELGSYHYVSGVDASSSATLAAYLNSLTYSMDDTQSWFSKSNAWRIRSGIYCCFNAFSRVDVRVEVKIPGGVEYYFVDVRGERHEVTQAIWQETYLSAVLRAILYSDDSYYRLAGYRKIDPITSLHAEAKFLEAVEALYWKGWQLGSKPEIQVATSVHNHLTAGVMKYFGDSFRYGPAIELFQKLQKKDPEVGALLAESYIGANEETKAVKVLYENLKLASLSYPLLHVQVDFLRSKGKYDMALQLAKYAVNTTPSEFLTWAKLTDVYIDIGDYKNALLTLNSCPMFTYSERDMHRMPAPQKTHLPIKQDIVKSGIMEDDTVGREGEPDPNLLRLPAPALHGTFAKAYSLLTRLAAKIGWDDLLKCRSGVFVMEEEYRILKAKEEERKTSISQHSSKAPKDSSTPSVQTASTTPSTVDQEDGSEKKEEEDSEKQEQTEETTEDTEKKEDVHEDKDDDNTNKEEIVEKMENVDLNEESEASDLPKMDEHSLERPQQAAEESKDGNEPAASAQDSSFSFGNKRLCERWLDNLFMVLYEDLRVYTFWRTEAAHYRSQQMPYRKTGTEWELLGDLALRLWHENEARESYELCLDHKFSAKAWMKLLEIYAKEGNVQKALLAAVKLTVYHERWYHEIVYPTEIACNLNKLIRKEGLSKMQNILTSMNLPRPVQSLITRYFDYGELFKVEGYEF